MHPFIIYLIIYFKYDQFVRLSTSAFIEKEDSHHPKPNLIVLVTYTVEKSISRDILRRYIYGGIVHIKITVVKQNLGASTI